MKKLILWTWQLPQTLLGFILIFYYKNILKRKIIRDNYKECELIYIKHFPSKKALSGISLGNYIILDEDRFLNNPDKIVTIKHEYGHVLQGYIFGPLYLLVIGLPSIIQNILSSISKKNVTQYWKYYYSRYPENWADKLGGVSKEERKEASWWIK